jgi:integrase
VGHTRCVPATDGNGRLRSSHFICQIPGLASLSLLPALCRWAEVTREWARLVREKKLPKVSFHALRHTHVSQLIASGMDVFTINRRIGHTNPNITLGVYGHLFKNTYSQAALVIEVALGNALSTK